MKFRKKPVVIEAMQFDGSYKRANDIQSWACIGGNTMVSLVRFLVVADTCHSLEIATMEGVMTANKGDWVIKGIKGEFYPCKPDIFAATYDPCDVQHAHNTPEKP